MYTEPVLITALMLGHDTDACAEPGLLTAADAEREGHELCGEGCSAQPPGSPLHQCGSAALLADAFLVLAHIISLCVCVGASPYQAMKLGMAEHTRCSFHRAAM
jgi:hypothetical protein